MTLLQRYQAQQTADRAELRQAFNAGIYTPRHAVHFYTERASDNHLSGECQLMPTGISCKPLKLTRDADAPLKLDDAWTREYNRKMYRDNGNGCTLPIYTDMGGYGILAPDLTED